MLFVHVTDDSGVVLEQINPFIVVFNIYFKKFTAVSFIYDYVT